MQIHFFPSSRRAIRNLQEAEPEEVIFLPEKTFNKNHDKELAEEILSFLEENFWTREEKINFLKEWAEGMGDFKSDLQYFLYVENEFPLSYFFDENKDRIEIKKNILAKFVPKTNRDFSSPINPALNIFSKILNSYKIKGLIICVTPLGLVPYDTESLEPLINIHPFYIPDIFNIKVVENMSRYLRLRAELMGKKPPKDSNLDEIAFYFEYNGKTKPITWKKVERECSKMLIQYFLENSEIFIKNNQHQKPILFLSQKPYLKKFREILQNNNLYDSEFDIVKNFLKNNPGDEDYMIWGLAAPSLIGRTEIDINNRKKFYIGKLERTIREKIGNERVELVYGHLLSGRVLKNRKLLTFFEIWLSPDIKSIEIYPEPVLCNKGSILLDYNEEEFCSYEKYLRWKEEWGEEKIKKLEEYVKERGPIQPWTYIIQQIQSKIEEELFPLKYTREESEAKSDYHFSDLNRTPVENLVRDVLEEEMKEREIVTSSGTKEKMKNLTLIGTLIHDLRRRCTPSCNDFTKFTEVPLRFKFKAEGHNYTISGIADIVVETKSGLLHICDTKLEASYSPPKSQRLQVYAEALAATQQFRKGVHSVSVFYATNIFKEGMLFVFDMDSNLQQKTLSEIGEQIYDYYQMKDSPNKIPKLFEKYKGRMRDPELVKKLIEEKFHITI